MSEEAAEYRTGSDWNECTSIEKWAGAELMKLATVDLNRASKRAAFFRIRLQPYFQTNGERPETISFRRPNPYPAR